jgi:hypothetical protein
MAEITNNPISNSDPENRNSVQYIYPFNDSQGSAILSRIVYHSKQKAEKAEMERIDKFKKYVLRLNDFYTIQELYETLKFDSSLTPSHKSTESLDDALREMIDLNNKGRIKYGYLYPVLQEINNELKAKILVSITPEMVALPTSVYRGIFIKYNKSFILNYLSSFRYDPESDYYKNPSGYLIKVENGVKVFNPYGLSILETLREILSDSFSPFTPIELTDFFQDTSEYCSNSEFALRLTDLYYLNQYEIVLNHQGVPTREPEVFFHFLSIYNVIEKLILEDINEYCDKYGLSVSKSQIKDYIRKFPKISIKDPNLLVERLKTLDSIMQKVNTSPRMDSGEKKIISSVKTGISLLFEFDSLIKKTNNTLAEARKKQMLENISLHIEDHFKVKKTLYVYDPERPFVESYDREKNTTENKVLVKNYIFENYYYYETSTHEGRPFYYILNPKCCLEVMVNLADLAQKNDSYSNQYKVVKLLRDKMIKDGITELDQNIELKQKNSLDRNLREIKEKEKKIEEIKEKKRSYNSMLAFATGGVSVILIMVLLMIYQNPFIMILIPLSLILSYYLGGIIKKAKKDLLNNNPNLNHFTEVSFDSNSSYYIDIVKKLLYDDSSKIEDKFLDKQKLSFLFLSMIPKIRENRPSMTNEVTDENIIENMLDITERLCLVITVPPEISKGSMAKQIYIAKENLKDNFTKAQLLEFCHNKQKVSKLNKSTDLERYYKYLADILDHDFSIYF